VELYLHSTNTPSWCLVKAQGQLYYYYYYYYYYSYVKTAFKNIGD